MDDTAPPPSRTDPQRRRFIRQVGGSALALGAAPLLPGCGGGGDGALLPTPPGSGPFRHGVASGDPLADRVILWTRVTPDNGAAVSVQLVVARDTALTQVVQQHTLSTDASRDHTVKIDVTGLAAGSTYYYRFSALGENSPIGRTRTLPTGSAARLRLAVLSCSNFAAGFFNAYRHVAERPDLDLVLHLGDYIYERGKDNGDTRLVEPEGTTVTLADYRLRHALHKRDPDLQELHRQHPMVAMWDDHEIVSDANATGAPDRVAGWGARTQAALQAYFEWLPVRVMVPGDLKRNYRTLSFGNLVDLVVLETRLVGRSPQLPATGTLDTFRQEGAFLDETREMLGAEQHAWAAGQLRGSGAKWKFVCQGVQFAPVRVGGSRYMNPDQWDGYQPARDRVMRVIRGDNTVRGVGNVVFLSGDAHSAWAADLAMDPFSTDLAAGGYDRNSGAGSLAVEFVATSVTSQFISDPSGLLAEGLTSASVNPHIKFANLEEQGYLLVDADASRVVGEWWFVDTVTEPRRGQSFAGAWQVLDGAGRLVPAGATTTPAGAPLPAPG